MGVAALRSNCLWIIVGAMLTLAGCGGGGGSSGSPIAASSTSSSSSGIGSGTSSSSGSTSSSSTSSTSSSGSTSSSSSGTGVSTSSSGSTSTGSSSSGSSSSGTAAANRIAVTVTRSAPGAKGGNINIVYASVTICLPNTSTCGTINNLQVDTGSVGLRVLASALKAQGLTLPATNDPATSGNIVAECGVFGDGYLWGPLTTADVTLGGETASGLAIQVIDDSSPPAYAAVPSGCTAQNSTSLNSASALTSNGLLGVGPFPEDCGSGCSACSASTNGCTASVDRYYSCGAGTSGSCANVQWLDAAQVANPIVHFPTDNNGSILYLEDLPAGYKSTAVGSLTFGIGTQSNNILPSTATVLRLDDSGNFITTASFNRNPDDGFFDSGSNAFFFDDGNLPPCTGSLSDFFCPTSTTNIMVVNQGQDSNHNLVGNTSQLGFQVANFKTATANGAAAYNNVAGGGVAASGTFDFGLPFFYGRSVYTGIYNTQAVGYPGLTGPYFAY
jgi:Protein of unknown function (DUF3443)